MNRSRLLIVAACILWSLSGLLGKLIELPGPTIACYRVLIAGAALLPFLKWRRVRFRPVMVAMVLCFTTMNVSYITALTLTTAANAIFLQYTSPLWIFLAGVLWLKERADRTSIVSLVLSMGGIAVILWGQGTAFNLGVVLALVAGISYAGVAVCLRYLRDEDPVYLTMLNMLGGGIFLFVALLFWPVPAGASSWLAVPSSNILPLIAFGVIQMALPYVLFTRALNHVSAQEAGIITLIEPMLVPVAAYLAVGEVPAVATMVGGAIILGAVLLRFLMPTRKAVAV